MFTYFTDRDGKFQLCALAESSFDPLARTTVHADRRGAPHVRRRVRRQPRDPAHLEVMNELKTDDVQAAPAGVIDLPRCSAT
jgi:benzoyl-CoA 2,3-dioxygenase component B